MVLQSVRRKTFIQLVLLDLKAKLKITGGGRIGCAFFVTNFASARRGYRSSLKRGRLPIAFLLGYQEINSFLRAFAIWTGKSISEYRKDSEAQHG